MKVLNLQHFGDAELVNSDISNENGEEGNLEESKNENSNIAQTSNTPASTLSDDYFTASKLERNVMYSQMIERYQAIISGNNQAAEQKTIAQQEINKINDIQNAIMITENLLTSKGFNKNIIFVNGNSINVIIGKEKLAVDEVAQIQNIISRELSAEIENIHIATK